MYPSSRRVLHQPLFPLYSSSPPTQPPSAPSFPKYPFSVFTNPPPFFPFYPSPPLPRPSSSSSSSSSSVPTFPANISSLVPPSHNAPHSSKLILIITFPTLSLILLSLLAVLFLIRRYRSSDKNKSVEPGSDSHRLVPPDSVLSDSHLLDATSAPASSAFLYLGTLVSSRGGGGRVAEGGGPSSVGPTADEESPELRPLPPLSRQSRRSYSSDDVFYSPRGAADRPHPACGSHSPVSSIGNPSSSSSSPPSIKPPPPLACSIQNPIYSEKDEAISRDPFAVSPPRRQQPPPPPPPPENPDDVASREEAERRRRGRKLKPLHWDKVRASSERNMVWDHLKSCSSFQLDEEKIETLFGCDSTMGATRNGQVGENVDVVIDPKKSRNIAILLRALNVTAAEVCEALLEGNTDSLDNELLDTLLKMAPSKEEELKLKEYKADSPFKLGPAEKFLKAMVDIPFAFKRVDAMLYIANFDSEISYLKQSFKTLELACEELSSSRLFRKLLDAVLKTGNRMNVGTNRGDARAFKLDTLLKLVDIKGTDGKTTLLHFVVQEISRAEGLHQQTDTRKEDDLGCIKLGLKVVSKLGTELSNVKKAATFDSEILIGYVSKLTGGIGKVREVVRLIDGRFRESMTEFLRRAEGEIAALQSQEGVTFSLVKDSTEYFHGDSTKEEAHPFRIFMVVRDFLIVLDQVCKEVGRVNERSVVSSSECFLGGWS